MKLTINDLRRIIKEEFSTFGDFEIGDLVILDPKFKYGFEAQKTPALTSSGGYGGAGAVTPGVQMTVIDIKNKFANVQLNKTSTGWVAINALKRVDSDEAVSAGLSKIAATAFKKIFRTYPYLTGKVDIEEFTNEYSEYAKASSDPAANIGTIGILTVLLKILANKI